MKRKWILGLVCLAVIALFTGDVLAKSIGELDPPKGNNTGRIGTSSNAWKEVYVYDATVNDTLAVTGEVNFAGGFTLDDGSGASPSLTFKDGHDETSVFSKVDQGYLTLTTDASDGLQILTGNLKVGDGTPGTAAMDGEDFYCKGQSEFDGTAQFDGAVTCASTLGVTGLASLTAASCSSNLTVTGNLTVNGNTDIGNNIADTCTITASIDANVTLDDGATHSPILYFKDATDHTAAFQKQDAGYLTITTLAAEGVNVVTGNLKVGSGTAGTAAMDGDDTLLSGQLEVDGTAQMDGAVTCASTLGVTGLSSLTAASVSSNLTVTGNSTMNGNVDLGNNITDTVTITGSIDATVTLDDGVTHSPILRFQDATNETADIQKQDSGYLTITTLAADGVNVVTGNMVVGTPSFGVFTPDGQDLVVAGSTSLEGDTVFGTDGADSLYFLANVVTAINLDDGAGASPTLVFSDESNEHLVMSKANGGYFNITPVNAALAPLPAEGICLNYGNWKVGLGSAGSAPLDGDDAYITGDAEIDGTTYLHGLAALTNASVSGNYTANGNTTLGNAVTDSVTITGSIIADVYIDDGSGDTPKIRFKDGSDEEAYIYKLDTGSLEINTGSDGVVITPGWLSLGAGAGHTLGGFCGYFNGTLEVDGQTFLDGDVDLGNAASDFIGFSGTVSTNITFEGATDDAAETTLAVEDPKYDTTLTMPQGQNGLLAVAVGTSYSPETAINETSDAYTLTVQDDTFAAGKTYRIDFTGTITGNNAGKQVILDVDGTAIATLDIAAATTGDFSGYFMVSEYTDWAHQRVWGMVQCAVAADGDADNGTDTTDFSSGNKNIKVQVISGNAGDIITMQYVTVLLQ